MITLAQLEKKIDRIAADVEALSATIHEADELDADTSQIATLTDQVRQLATLVESFKTKIEQRTELVTEHVANLEQLSGSLGSIQDELENAVETLGDFT